MKNIKIVLTALALSLGLGMAGARAQAQQELVIGAANALTGGAGEAARQVVVGLQIAVDEINAKGGIKSLGGAKLRVVSADTSSDNPTQAANVIRRIITENKPVILVGSHVSTMTLATQIEAEKAEIPILTTSFADELVQRGYKYTFKIAPQSSALAQDGIADVMAMYKELKGKDIKRVAIFNGSDANAQSTGAALADVAKAMNLEVVATNNFPSDMTDPTPVIVPTQQTHPDVIFLNGFPNNIILVARALRALGIETPIVSGGSAVSSKSVIQALGQSANGVTGNVAWNYDLPIPGVKEFDAAYSKANPNEPYPPQEAGEGYAIGQIIGAVLEKAASTDPKKIRDVLAAYDGPSILPGARVKFTPQGQNSEITSVLIGWQDGKLSTVWPKQYKTVDLRLP